MAEHEKALVEHRAVRAAMGQLIRAEEMQCLATLNREVMSLALGRLNVLVPKGAWEDLILLTDIREMPILFDYLLAEGLSQQRQRDFGISRNWVEGCTSRFVRPYAVRRPVFSDGLFALSQTRPDLIYHESYLPQVRVCDDRHEADEPKGAAGKRWSILMVEELDSDPRGRDPVFRLMSQTVSGDIRPRPRVPDIIWLALEKLPRERACRYFFLSDLVGHWDFCEWSGRAWTFYDGRHRDPKGERFKKGDQLILHEREYWPK